MLLLKKLNFTREQIEYAAQNFSYKYDAAKYLNCSKDTFTNYLKLYNIDFKRNGPYKGTNRPDCTHSFITKEWMIQNWVNTNKSMRELSEQLNVPESVLDYRREKYGLVKRFCYPFNRTKFFNLEDVNVWYLAGLVATDGYVPKGIDTIELSLIGTSERTLLEEIHSYFELTSPICSYRSDKSDTFIRISGEGINKFYEENFGIVSGPKTFNVSTPKTFPSEDCAKAYFRGCLDGDGTVAKDGQSFSILTASEDFIDGIVSILNKYVGTEFHKRYEVYPIVSGCQGTGKKVLDWTYSLENCFCLKRKHERYLSKLMI